MPPTSRDGAASERRGGQSPAPSRRALLSAGAATLASAAAGCSELPDLSTDAGEGTPALPEAVPGGDPGAAAVATARDALADGQAALDDFVEQLPAVYASAEPPERVPADRVEEGVRTARRALDRLGSDPPAARARTAAALRGYADYQHAAVAYFEGYLPVLHALDAYRAYRLADRYESAGGALSSATDALDSLPPLREAATGAASDLDRDALAAVGIRLSASAVPGWLADAAARQRFAARLVDGFASEVGGLSTLRAAHGAFDAEQYSTAEERFLDAKSGFSEAEARFVALEGANATLPGATDVAVRYACRANAMFDHCDAMAGAARAARFGQASKVAAASERARAARERAAECVSGE